MTYPKSVVVVGAGLAGVQACEQLRRHGYQGMLRLLGEEECAPYDRPPLTKGVLQGKMDDTTLRIDLRGLDIEFHSGVAAESLSVSESVLETTCGSFGFDALVIATGARPITLPGNGRQHTVRNIEDALALRERLMPRTHVAIIGASWIGAEVATVALAKGCNVTCLEASPTVAHGVLGDLGRRLESWWAQVDLRLGVQVASISAEGVVLADGQVIAADVVVTGIGALANIEWLEGSGLELDRGVVVDSHLCAADNIVAVGDVATWWSERFQRRLRVEHWDHAVLSAETAAASLLGSREVDQAYDPIPYFWSDQFGHKIQYLGAHGGDCASVVREMSDPAKWSAGWFDPQGRMVGFLGVNSPKETLAARELMTSSSGINQNRFADATVPLKETITAASVSG